MHVASEVADTAVGDSMDILENGITHTTVKRGSKKDVKLEHSFLQHAVPYLQIRICPKIFISFYPLPVSLFVNNISCVPDSGWNVECG
jgi:hypothetical protein